MGLSDKLTFQADPCFDKNIFGVFFDPLAGQKTPQEIIVCSFLLIVQYSIQYHADYTYDERSKKRSPKGCDGEAHLE